MKEQFLKKRQTSINLGSRLTIRSTGLGPLTRPSPVSSNVEAVEKVPKQILGRDAEKNYLTECATINDLMFGKGEVTPENIVLTWQKDFSYRLVMRRII